MLESSSTDNDGFTFEGNTAGVKQQNVSVNIKRNILQSEQNLHMNTASILW